MRAETVNLLDDIRSQVAARDEALRVARGRRVAVLEIAARYDGSLRTYRSGSLAAGLMDHPVTGPPGD